MKPTLERLLEEKGGKKFMIAGRTKLFTKEEITRYLKPFGITLTDLPDSETIAVIESPQLNAFEEMQSEEAYAMGIPHYPLEMFEALLSRSLDEDSIRMVLKLSGDTDRLVRLLSNIHISDDFFIKLLRMYQWEGEEIMETGSNRKVLYALLQRFLDLRPEATDLLHSPGTLLKLIRETENPELLDALMTLPDFTFLQQKRRKITLREAIASSPHLPAETIRKLFRLNDEGISISLAANPATDIETLRRLHARKSAEIDAHLATNPRIDDALFKTLLEGDEEIVSLLLSHQPIDPKRFEMVADADPGPECFCAIGRNLLLKEEVRSELMQREDPMLLEALAANPTLEGLDLEKLYTRAPEMLAPFIAANPSAPPKLLAALLPQIHQNEKIALSLASNPSATEEMLRRLYALERFDIHERLAANPSTPMDLLDLLKLDPAFRRALSQNPTFTQRIKQDLGIV